MAERWRGRAQSHWTLIRLMCPPVHEAFSKGTSFGLVPRGSGSINTISRWCSSEEYSHVISIKEPSWSGLGNAAGNACCLVYVCHPRRSSGPACSEVGALRRILLLSFRRGCIRPASGSIGPTEQPPGSQSARRGRQCYL